MTASTADGLTAVPSLVRRRTRATGIVLAMAAGLLASGTDLDASATPASPADAARVTSRVAGGPSIEVGPSNPQTGSRLEVNGLQASWSGKKLTLQLRRKGQRTWEDVAAGKAGKRGSFTLRTGRVKLLGPVGVRVTAAGTSPAASRTETVRFVPKLPGRFSLLSTGSTENVAGGYSIASTPDHSVVVYGTARKTYDYKVTSTVFVVDRRTGTTTPLNVDAEQLCGLSADGTQLLYVWRSKTSSDQTFNELRILDLSTGVVTEVTLPSKWWVTSGCGELSADGSSVAVPASDFTAPGESTHASYVAIWDRTTGATTTAPFPTGATTDYSAYSLGGLSADGSTVTYVNKPTGGVWQWNRHTGAPRRVFSAAPRAVTKAAASPDGSRVAVARLRPLSDLRVVAVLDLVDVASGATTRVGRWAEDMPNGFDEIAMSSRGNVMFTRIRRWGNDTNLYDAKKKSTTTLARTTPHSWASSRTLSPNGRSALFVGRAPLTKNDTDGDRDVFLWERTY